MPTAVHLTTSSSTTNATSYTTGSVAPTGGRLVTLLALVAVNSSGNRRDIDTVTGLGVTWEPVLTPPLAPGLGMLSMWRTRAASYTPGTVTFSRTDGVTWTNGLWQIVEWDGADTSGVNGAGAIVQAFTDGTTTAANSVNASFPNTVAAGNATYAGVGTRYQGVLTAGAGWSAVGQTNQNNISVSLLGEWAETAQQTVTASWATADHSYWYGVEIKAAAAVAPKTGSAAGAWSFTGAAAGRRVTRGAGAGSWTFTGTAPGKRAPKGSGGGGWTFTGTAAGRRTPKATGSGGWATTGTSTGKRTPKGTTTGTWAYTGTVTIAANRGVLQRFLLQLPTGTDGNADEITRDQLAAGYTSTYFQDTPDGAGFRFYCPVSGATTSGTSFPRTELREVNLDGTRAAWHPSDGATRTIQGRCRINHLPDADPETTLIQVHNESTEVVALRTARIGAGTIRIAWRLNGSTQTTNTITQDYQWGTDFTVKIVVDPVNVTVYGNSTQMYQWPVSTLTPGPNNKFYLKAGNYLQANETTAPADEYGDVDWRDLAVAYDAPSTPGQGAGTGTWTFTGTGTGRRAPTATGAGTWTTTGAATGTAPTIAINDGAATGTTTYTGTAAGRTTRAAAGVGTWATTGTATGRTTRRGVGTGTWTTGGTATGRATRIGTGTGATSWDGAATGTTPVVGVNSGYGTGTWTTSGAATGTSSRRATAAGTWTTTGAATGRRLAKATAVGGHAWQGTAAGTAPTLAVRAGTAAGTHTWAGTATGVTAHYATGTGTTGWVGTANGAVTYAGTTVGDWSYTGDATGVAYMVAAPPPPRRIIRTEGQAREIPVGPRPRVLDTPGQGRTIVVTGDRRNT